MADNNQAMLAIAQGIAQGINNLSQSFPQVAGTGTTATGGAATLPANPVGFLTVTLPNGTSARIPYYS